LEICPVQHTIYQKGWDELLHNLEDNLETIKKLVFEPPPGRENRRTRSKLRTKDTERNLVTTTSTTEFYELQYWCDHAIKMAHIIRPALSSRRMTMDLILDWGSFQFACGIVVAGPLTGKADAGRLRTITAAKNKRSRHGQILWCAREILSLIDTRRVKRDRAESLFVQALLLKLDEDSFTADFPRGWFAAMLSHKTLKSTYLQKKLTVKTMRKLTVDSNFELPPMGFLEYPVPQTGGRKRL
jgi:hypothetical protein